ncbi:calcium-transporting ATPase 12, plasma membrane-type [Helianthus annuus]|uniref:calcium-transporting ATPase 12, plasma membrane-type n=1 Tax=Helianthus annuus TaxID=4232 RepID=UPI000B902BDC|nr:calcium-transporting ATPase 12, plasma membrane-type [Helianthus annuus]
MTLEKYKDKNGSNFPHVRAWMVVKDEPKWAPIPNEKKFLAPPLTKAKKRWRLAYFTISFSNTLVSFAKNLISKALPVSEFPTYSVIEIIPQTDVPKVSINIKDNSDHHFKHHGIDQTQLVNIIQNKDLATLRRADGVKGLAKTLDTHLQNGINGQDLDERITVFGSNTYQKPPPKGLFYFVAEAFKDVTILILMGCAVLSLGFGIKEDGIKEGWYEGGSILLAVFLVIVVSAVSNFRQEKQFDSLSKISNNIKTDVVREGRRQKISIFDIVVGDIVVLNVGDQIPADGLFIDGHSLLVDESSMTGESCHVYVNADRNPFLISGAKVADGHCRMLVLSVGMNTSWGKMMSSITGDNNEQTPLQSRLNKLTSSIGKVGLAVAFLVLLVMLIRYFTGNTEDENGKREYNGKGTSVNEILDSVTGIFSAAVTIVVVAIPEGLPLAVTLTLAYSMKRMMSDQAMVRKLSACETMGSATVICTDKTGTLTMNQMTVTKFWLGLEYIEQHASNVIALQVLELLHEAVGLNTTGTIFKHASRLVPEYSGSPTEKAILSWAVEELEMDMEKLKQCSTVLHVETFNSKQKRSGVSIRRNNDNTIHVHWKGAAEMVLAMCSKYYISNGCKEIIDSDSRKQLENIIEGMAASSLRCIAFAHKKVFEGTETLAEEGLTLLGIVGLKDPCRPGSRKAIETCRFAGVEVKMITGDNLFTAKAIATECGILESGQEVCEDEVVEGVQFRNFTDEERMQKVDRIRVMARSSPFDKLLMVKCLKQKGHVVAVTGDGTNDAPALKEADIGLSMGIQGTEVAKQSSDIVILDDDIATISTVLMWGRCVYNNIQKFIQFQLTVNVAALVINFIAAVTSGGVPLTAVQLLWVNLIMDTLGALALALATEGPTKELLNKPPVGRVEPLITNIMWRNLLAQAIFQITVLLTFQFRGEAILNVNERVKDTIIYNTFVLCQVFNEFNSRKLEKRNIFKGIHKNRLFIGIIGITIILQIVMVEFLNKFADTERLNGVQWGICIGIAALSWPIGWVMKLIRVPDKPFLSYIRR